MKESCPDGPADVPELVAELNRLEFRPSRSGKSGSQGSRGFHDDLAMVTATLCHDLDGAMIMTKEAIDNVMELMAELRTPGVSRTAFADVTGVPGLPNWSLDRL